MDRPDRETVHSACVTGGVVGGPVTQRTSWLSPLFLAVALTPTLLQTFSCERGDTFLLDLQFLVGGEDLIEGFNINNRAYAVTTAGGTVTVTAEARMADSNVTYQWLVSGTSIEAGEIGLGGGTVVLTIPNGQSQLRVNVRAVEGVVDGYTVEVDRPVDPFCGSTTPIVDRDLNLGLPPGAPSLQLYQSPDGSQIVLADANELLSLDVALLSTVDSFILSDNTTALTFTTPSPPESLLVSARSAFLEAIDTTSFDVAWRRFLGRSGCANDALSQGVYHDRTMATPTFQSTYSESFVYVGTRFEAGGTGCSIGVSTDNRVYALDDTTGAIEWSFNGGTGGSSRNVDAVTGMALDRSTDRLFFTTERSLPGQNSVWALDVLNGSDVWSFDADRILAPPLLFDGRLYVANVPGEIIALDPATGVELWSTNPLFVLGPGTELTATKLSNGNTLLAVVDLIGQIRVVEDLGASPQEVAWFQLPDGDPGIGTLPRPSVEAVSKILAAPDGRALVGANDGRVYSLDLLTGTVTGSLAVDGPTTPVPNLVLEPPGLYGTPGSVLVGTNDTVARYCIGLEVGEAL